MELVHVRSRLSDNDRLGVTAFGSLLLHMLVIMGVTFTVPKLREMNAMPNIDITLVQASSDRAPDKADFLAQANQDGGGESNTRDFARNPLPLFEVSEQRAAPAARPSPQTAVPTKRDTRELMTQATSDKRIATPQPEPQRKEAHTDPAKLGVPSKNLQEERAQLNAAVALSMNTLSNWPKRKFLTARTQEYKYAVYLEGWRAKTERIGNLHYPEEAKRRGIRGEVLLNVTIRHDGSFIDAVVARSSGHEILDNAALNCARLAAPYAPFTPELRAEADEITISRSWRYGETLTTQ
ncbi:MAG: energy transducer TonB [Gammaproteobacteria bacterium]|nr:energy transducer TonB [Gammaproteobacteria bacterium]